MTPDQTGQPMEGFKRNKKVINEQSNLFEQYLSSLTGNTHTPKETKYERAKVYDSDSLLINEEFDKMKKDLLARM